MNLWCPCTSEARITSQNNNGTNVARSLKKVKILLLREEGRETRARNHLTCRMRSRPSTSSLTRYPHIYLHPPASRGDLQRPAPLLFTASTASHEAALFRCVARECLRAAGDTDQQNSAPIEPPSPQTHPHYYTNPAVPTHAWQRKPDPLQPDPHPPAPTRPPSRLTEI